MYKLVALALLGLMPLAAQRPFSRRAGEQAKNLAPYVTSPQPVIDKMLAVADLKPSDVVYDLGSGDGRILISAAQRYRVKGVGIEISETLVKAANEKVRQLGLDDRITIVNDDLMNVDLSPASVVVMYLDTMSNEALKPKLEKYLKPGTRVISHDFVIRGWKPVRTEQIFAFNRSHNIYIYEMPAKGR